MKKWMLPVTAALLLPAFTCSARAIDKSRELSAFENVEVGGGFEITFTNSDSFSAEWTVDDEIEPFTEIYVRNNTLFVNLNKEGRKYLRKNFKGRSAPQPTLKVTVSMANIKKLKISDNSSVSAASEPLHSNDFFLEVGDKGRIPDLTVNADGKDAEIVLSKDADVTMRLQAKRLKISASHSAQLALTHASEEAVVSLEGSANVGLSGNVPALQAETKNSAKLNLQGDGRKLTCKGVHFSRIEAQRFAVDEAYVTQNGAEVWVNARKLLEISLSGGAELVYCGKPEFNILSIRKSSVIRIEDKEKR